MKTEAENRGYWYWTWDEGTPPPSKTTISIAFSGYSDVLEAIEQSKHVKDQLVGTKYIAIGGGNANGAFTKSKVEALTREINTGAFTGYDGIAYDIEEGDPNLEEVFAESFQAARTNGLQVLVTVSHSAPYGISDAAKLMTSFFTNENINILSPQLYTSGNENENNYQTSHGVCWSEYKDCKAAVVPSIVEASLYESAKQYFLNDGVTLEGYIQWTQTS
ncbi:MAG: hypothetical protein JKY19_08715 [Alcanivoracaceae bacterium]|nr:hypothetical protein [Alcanivoracaceae bacterium]